MEKALKSLLPNHFVSIFAVSAVSISIYTYFIGSNRKTKRALQEEVVERGGNDSNKSNKDNEIKARPKASPMAKEGCFEVLKILSTKDSLDYLVRTAR